MLTNEELTAIKNLKAICENKERYELKLNFDMLETRKGDVQEDYFHYEDGKLVGFLGSYGFGDKAEICGMVHPDFRRKGIFSMLFKACVKDLNDRQIETILLNAPADSSSAKNYLKNLPCTYYMTEYQMKWQTTEMNVDPTVVVRPSLSDEDFEAEVQLDIQAFGFKEEEARHYNEILRENRQEQRLIIAVDGKTAGKMRVAEVNNEAWIYGFAIFPALQGKGIGRKALSSIVTNLNQKGLSIYLEVEAKNHHALKLYEACGFRSYHAQDYYKYHLTN
ncbi:GNAT family N-acetyltransferase [Niallia circulans]|uniref:GNAT family N-acetyltransferase n=1 Tax=Niallia circulans TaxID=1397 RepID=A0A553SSK2_NIACI|nr:GNAT family N-acetyltransferase [Niallia circulans]TRZ39980.1 GNAT family N-acetyltransferase [Niallia circulans]